MSMFRYAQHSIILDSTKKSTSIFGPNNDQSFSIRHNETDENHYELLCSSKLTNFLRKLITFHVNKL